MIDISIIIVNYNVRYFLEQCLISISKAVGNLNVEIFVVDNNSIDNSVESIKNKFPDVQLIANKENVGFAKANNQAMKLAKGKYILLLNPDTLVEEDTLVRSYEYMEQNQDTGALGVKLIDGEGAFLPESKRGFPNLSSSFFRLSGLSKLFPKSKIFNRYNLGFLDENKIAEVDVLCGAFMFIRRSILDEVGLLDEDFFMYGEDIDFSYRIKKAGYKIIYFPKTKIIHFKGESTKKSSLKYHNIFYRAMAIFAKKHYGGTRLNPLLILINISVVLLSFFNFVKSIVKKYILIIVDYVICFYSMFAVQKFWANFHFHNSGYYNTSKTSILFAVFSAIWVAGIFFAKGYHKNHFVNMIKGLFGSTLLILVFYSLLPENIRYSRAIILISSLVIFVLLLFFRLLFRRFFPGMINIGEGQKKIAIVGSRQEADRVIRIMDINGVDFEFMGIVATDSGSAISGEMDLLGEIGHLEDIVELNKLDEIIFCLKDIKMNKVTELMGKIGRKVRIKVVPEESYGIIGSSDRNSKGEFYSMEVNYKLDNKFVLFFKYFSDKIVALFMLLFFPVIKVINPKFKFFYIMNVLSGKNTWIGYDSGDDEFANLPGLKKGIYTPVFSKKYKGVENNYLHNLNVLYARNYNVWLDMEYLFKHLFIKNNH